MAVTPCAVCGSAEQEPHYPNIVRCIRCGHVFADLAACGEGDLTEIYRRAYFAGDEYRDYVADRRVLQRNFRLRMKVLQRYLSPVRHRRLLEIGSAYGFFLDTVRDRFDTVTGIDVTDTGVSYSRDVLGLDARVGDFTTYDFGHDRFDVLCMWDTMEHLQSPQRFVARAADLTDSGAVLAITTGDIGSVVARVKKERWRLVHPPSHAHYFSLATLTRMLGENGFDVVHTSWAGMYRSSSSIAHFVLVLRHGRDALFERLYRGRLLGWDIYSNLFDIRYVIATRR